MDLIFGDFIIDDMFLYMYTYIEKQVKIHELFCRARLPLLPPYFAPGIGQTITE
jgi:hypothetical protein